MEKKAFDIAISEEFLNKRRVFVVHCLNLGITSQGYTYEEALENIQEAIQLCVDEYSPKELNRLAAQSISLHLVTA